ncbi:MAG: FGGY family carbohydrate kinase [Litoreibacter sp.]|nr:FGGY family carbohydrate kinase [Litoreibacter sp.]MCY4333478.1 FGGY family carbohydrate kinase [Litoreibacter sp.]
MSNLYLGMDLGTSGARVSIVDACGQSKAMGAARLDGARMRDPDEWWRAVKAAMFQALADVSTGDVCAVAVSATSGTVLAVGEDDRPTGQVFMYSDLCPDAVVLQNIRQKAPDWSPARGGTGGLGCALTLARSGVHRVAHQADWINFKLCGAWRGDSSSALKSGYDIVAESWPAWVAELGLVSGKRSDIAACGTKMGQLSPKICDQFGFRRDVTLVAGTTDGCASFLATGADEIGDAVTVLGTTLTVKLLSGKPVFDASVGVYSHQVEGKWLVGGASNSGGGVLLDHFPMDDLTAVSAKIDGTKGIAKLIF